MSVLSQNARPYKIEVYGLQDDYIATLQSYSDDWKGQVIEPQINLQDDGTQSLSLKIPKYYIDEATNTQVENPRWSDVVNGVIAENTRVLKCFVEYEDVTEVYPFIIDKIVDSRDGHFEVYKQITANSLSFAELGKIGYKIELSEDVLLLEEKTSGTPITANINYWLDKVFPNEKTNGNITHWSTPWCYEIRMDWSGYTGARATDKIYNDPYVGDWVINDDSWVPQSLVNMEEKEAIVSASNSNKYNICQTIAETFGVYCTFEYKNDNGRFLKGEYTDSNQKVWTGKKVIFYNKAINLDNPYILNYQNNLQTVSRTCDTSDVYTKLYVQPIENGEMTDGYITIANSSANKTYDEFLLNFDYLKEVGSINSWQESQIDKYVLSLRKHNKTLIEINNRIEAVTTKLNEKNSEAAIAKAEYDSALEQANYYTSLCEETSFGSIQKDKNNSYSAVFVAENRDLIHTMSLSGVDHTSLSGYTNGNYSQDVFSNLSEYGSTKPDGWYYIKDEYGYVSKIIGKGQAENSTYSTGAILYLKFLYAPANKYADAAKQFTQLAEMYLNKLGTKPEGENPGTGLYGEIYDLEQQLDTLYNSTTALSPATSYGLVGGLNTIIAAKQKLNNDFEKVMGPALREGYWTPDSYSLAQDDLTGTVTHTHNNTNNGVSFIWDEQAFDGEDKNWYYASVSDHANDVKTYYDYLPLTTSVTVTEAGDIPAEAQAITDIGSYQLVMIGDNHYTVPSTQVEGWKAGNYYLNIDATSYYFTLPSALKRNETAKLCYGIPNISGATEQSYYLSFNLTSAPSPTPPSVYPDQPYMSYTLDEMEQLMAYFKTFGSTEGKQKVATAINAFYTNGNVTSIASRPQVTSSQMRAAGWTEFEDGDFATLYSQAKDNNNIMVELTPIIVNGSTVTQILSPTEVNNYFTWLFTNSTTYAAIKAKDAGADGKHIILNGYSFTSFNEAIAQLEKENELFYILKDCYYSDWTQPETPLTDIILSAEPTTGVTYSNATLHFTNNSTQINLLRLSDNSGFNFGWKKTVDGQTTSYDPILILNEPETYHYNERAPLGWCYNSNKTNVNKFVNSVVAGGSSVANAYTEVYPRLVINEDNVNYNSDLLTVTVIENTTEKALLYKYYDYQILLRQQRPYITLKTDTVNYDASMVTVDDVVKGNMLIKYLIDNYSFKVNYQVSRANDQLYIDASKVAKENSYPQYSYSVQSANLPTDVAHHILGELVYINDYAVGLYRVSGYVSGITLKLDDPSNDELVIQNYKTKFEDLFSSISATNEAMRTNTRSYEIAASCFNTDGTIKGDILTKTFASNNAYISFCGSKVEWNDEDGLVVSNLKPYANGVVGQVAIKGGGVFISSQVDSDGDRIWSNAITPNGINASAIQTGRLDTDLIRIFSGENVAFQWNSEGLFAYQDTENFNNAYIRFNKDGLMLTKMVTLPSELDPTVYQSTLIPQVELSWSGFTIRNDNNEKVFYIDTQGNLVTSGIMQSTNYVEGPTGSGWRIFPGDAEHTASADFVDVNIRGSISASSFTYNEISSVGGKLLVAPTVTVQLNIGDNYKFTYDANHYLNITLPFHFTSGTIACGHTWQVGNEIALTGNLKNTTDSTKTYSVKGLILRAISVNTQSNNITFKSIVSYDAGASIPTIVNANGTAYAIPDIPEFNSLIFDTNINLIYYSNYDSAATTPYTYREGIEINAQDANGPYIDVYGSGTNQLKARLGNLNGLRDTIGIQNPGYGLYSENVYLTGKINATSGRIGSVSINEAENTLVKSAMRVINKFSNGYQYDPAIGLTTTVTAELYKNGEKLTTQEALAPYTCTWSIIDNNNQTYTAAGFIYNITINADASSYPVHISCTITTSSASQTTIITQSEITDLIRTSSGIADIENYSLDLNYNVITRMLNGDVNPSILEIRLYKTNADGEQTLVEIPESQSPYTYQISLSNGTILSIPDNRYTRKTDDENRYLCHELNLADFKKNASYGDITSIEIQCVYLSQGQLSTIIARNLLSFVESEFSSCFNKVDGMVLIDGGKIQANTISSDSLYVSSNLWTSMLQVSRSEIATQVNSLINANNNVIKVNDNRMMWLHFDATNGLIIAPENYDIVDCTYVQIQSNGLFINQKKNGITNQYMSFASNQTIILNPTVNGSLQFNNFNYKQIEISELNESTTRVYSLMVII